MDNGNIGHCRMAAFKKNPPEKLNKKPVRVTPDDRFPRQAYVLYEDNAQEVKYSSKFTREKLRVNSYQNYASD